MYIIDIDIHIYKSGQAAREADPARFVIYIHIFN